MTPRNIKRLLAAVWLLFAFIGLIRNIDPVWIATAIICSTVIAWS